METDEVSETFCFLEYRTMDKVQKPSNPKCHTALSELFKSTLVPIQHGFTFETAVTFMIRVEED
jgi:hypothetical protein